MYWISRNPDCKQKKIRSANFAEIAINTGLEHHRGRRFIEGQKMLHFLAVCTSGWGQHVLPLAPKEQKSPLTLTFLFPLVPLEDVAPECLHYSFCCSFSPAYLASQWVNFQYNCTIHANLNNLKKEKETLYEFFFNIFFLPSLGHWCTSKAKVISFSKNAFWLLNKTQKAIFCGGR